MKRWLETHRMRIAAPLAMQQLREALLPACSRFSTISQLCGVGLNPFSGRQRGSFCAIFWQFGIVQPSGYNFLDFQHPFKRGCLWIYSYHQIIQYGKRLKTHLDTSQQQPAQ
jgi:hypothetical protein